MDAIEGKQFRADYTEAIRWYDKWKKKYELNGSFDVAGYILAHTWNGCLIEAYAKLFDLAQKDSSARIIYRSDIDRPKMVRVIAENLADERGVNYESFEKE